MLCYHHRHPEGKKLFKLLFGYAYQRSVLRMTSKPMQNDKLHCSHFLHTSTGPVVKGLQSDLRKSISPAQGDKSASKLISADFQNKSHDHIKVSSDESCSAASLSHWWETPSGVESQGGARGCTFSPQQAVSASSMNSDVTFEGRTAWNNVVDNCSQHKTIILNSSTPVGAHVCQGEKIRIPSNDLIPERMANSQIDNVQTLDVIDGHAVECRTSDEPDNKEKMNRMTKDRKKVTTNDVFAPILPTCDEVQLQWRISELRAALRASESTRIESERETHALCKYLAEVEAAAASLQSQVQELEHLILFSSKDDAKELDQLRKTMVVEASQVARNHAATAAQAVAAARDATMELDRVKRHASALIKAQEEEIIRLSMEAVDCRTLYNERAGELQVMKDEIEKLNQIAKDQSKSVDDALMSSQDEITDLRNKLKAAKVTTEEKSIQYADSLNAYQFTKEAAKAAENSLGEVEGEKKELLNVKGFLEQQVLDLQSEDLKVVGSCYDYEIRKVLALLENEKHHLLAELAMLRHGNQTLQGEVVQWKEKFDALSRRVSGLDSMSVVHMSGSEGKKQPGIFQNMSADTVSEVEINSLSHQEDSRQCKLCALKMTTGKEAQKGASGLTVEQVDNPSRISTSRKCIIKETRIGNIDGDMHQNDGNTSINVADVGNMVSSKRDVNVSMPVDDCESCQKTSCLFLRDSLLSAAHKEIVKLKEINQCLVAACQNDFKLTKEWDAELIKNNGCSSK